ncbi:MAG: hypothetical protein RL094_340 [Candidatus Parcubacteria bacterium]|jgi:hypothetical protein
MKILFVYTIVFFRVLVLTWAVQQQEFRYLVLFIMAASIWIIESIALYIDPKLIHHPLIRLANFLFIVLVILVATIHIIPNILAALKVLIPALGF